MGFDKEDKMNQPVARDRFAGRDVPIGLTRYDRVDYLRASEAERQDNEADGLRRPEKTRGEED